jgi:hypothetical protein
VNTFADIEREELKFFEIITHAKIRTRNLAYILEVRG